jgi:hypothetical protein
MSETNGKPRGRPPYRWHDKNMDALPGDEQANLIAQTSAANG